MPTNPTAPVEPTGESGDTGPNDAKLDGTPYSQTKAARRQWQPVAQRLARNLTRTHGATAADWQARLVPDVTTGSPSSWPPSTPLPVGRYDSLQPVHYEEYQVAVRTDYRES